MRTSAPQKLLLLSKNPRRILTSSSSLSSLKPPNRGWFSRRRVRCDATLKRGIGKQQRFKNEEEEETSSSSSSSYLRMRETDDGDWELQSAHVKYTNDAETCEIDLIATVHVGEEEYYGNLELELMMDPTTGSKIDDDDDDDDDDKNETKKKKNESKTERAKALFLTFDFLLLLLCG